MTRIIKAVVFALISGALLCAAAKAQGTYTAATCSQSDVNAVINGPTHTAVSGDVIVIPTCSATTWSSGITITVAINITGTGTPNTGAGTFGAGTSTTTLVESGTVPFFKFTSLTYGQTAKVELLNLGTTNTSQTLQPGAVAFSGTCTSSGCANIRADNLTFTTGEWANALDGGMVAVDNVFGVIDHNSASESPSSATFLAQVSNSAWQGVGTYGDNSFASADTIGTAQQIYIENNNVAGIRMEDNDVSASGQPGGARWTCRFNKLTNMSGDGLCGAHGTAWGGRFRGMRQMESYYNVVSGSVCNTLEGVLSGVAYMFSNSYTGSGCNAVVSVGIARFIQTGAPWNSCDGTRPWDQVPFTSSSACLDQPGSGAGAGLENATPVLVSAPGTPCTTAGQCWPNPALDPIYEAGETTPNNAPGISVASDGSSTRLLANVNYYGQVSDVAQTSSTSPFNGTSGTGYGTLARRPTTCTPAVGYWATDTGTWNSYNSQQGTLYICTATNTWSLHYTPYTYPHPLTQGTAPAPPTNLLAVPN